MGRPVYEGRKRERVEAERLAAGQPLEFTKSLSKEVRTKISWAMLNSSPAKVEPRESSPTWAVVGSHLQRILFKNWGRTTGLTVHMDIERSADVTGYLINDYPAGSVTEPGSPGPAALLATTVNV